MANHDESEIIYQDVNGCILTAGELMKFKLDPKGGTIDLGPELREQRPIISEEALVLHKQARTAGSKGDYPAAIQLLTRAHHVAPEWPYPFYDMAYTYLLLKDYEEALKYYELTLSLAPNGFFTARTAADVLKKEKDGVYPKGLYLTYLLAIESEHDPQKKISIIVTLLKKVPHFSLGYSALSELIEDEPQRLKLIDIGLTHQPDIDTKTTLLMNKAIILSNIGKKTDAIEILGGMIFNSSINKNSKAMAYLTLASIAL